MRTSRFLPALLAVLLATPAVAQAEGTAFAETESPEWSQYVAGAVYRARQHDGFLASDIRNGASSTGSSPRPGWPSDGGDRGPERSSPRSPIPRSPRAPTRP